MYFILLSTSTLYMSVYIRIKYANIHVVNTRRRMLKSK